MTTADPARLDDPELIREVIEWDVHNWSRALPIWRPHLPPSGSRALTLGERNGGLSLWLALHGLQVEATDVRGLTDEARASHRRHGCEELIGYGTADAADLSGHDDESFDVVAFKSVLGALETRDRQAAAIAEMVRVLRPGGVLCLAENLSATRLHQWIRHRFVPWSRSWRYLDLAADRSLFDGLEPLSEQACGFLALVGRNERQRALLGRVDDVVAPRLPATMRYILLGAYAKA